MDINNSIEWAELLKAIAHPTRLQIVAELLKGTKCVTDIQEILPASQANISQHLTVLRHAGIVNFVQDGAQRCYFISRPRFVSSVITLLEEGEPLVQKTREDVRREKSVGAFDEYAADYDAWFDEHHDLFQAELAAVRSLLPTCGKGVEIGVGTGRFADSLGIAIGVEPSPQMAEMARFRGIEVVEGVAEALPFDDGSFDFALMVTLDCFLSDVAKAFHEAFRILKTDGVLIVGLIDRESALGHQYAERKERSRFYRGAAFHSAGELETYLKQAGFSSFTCRQTLLPGETRDFTILDGHGSGGFVVIRAGKDEEEQ